MEMNLTYELAYQELEEIYDLINNEQVSIDELATKVKRAAVLINFCQDKLRSTEAEINGIIVEMNNTEKSDAGNSTARESGTSELF
ncbi:exodeoxyribonuclease VII small subunit [Desertivirga xinjiangensis]|uniref:exodeoxyribonuclease VII small subunit n=1 Tax=Desertivirga xinjiangensis TaxID=539206 RepID=UPI00210CB267|nr:exodeoxyribonuclease VII small subunit [Pedobacter xinjiangensis]